MGSSSSASDNAPSDRSDNGGTREREENKSNAESFERSMTNAERPDRAPATSPSNDDRPDRAPATSPTDDDDSQTSMNNDDRPDRAPATSPIDDDDSQTSMNNDNRPDRAPAARPDNSDRPDRTPAAPPSYDGRPDRAPPPPPNYDARPDRAPPPDTGPQAPNIDEIRETFVGGTTGTMPRTVPIGPVGAIVVGGAIVADFIRDTFFNDTPDPPDDATEPKHGGGLTEEELEQLQEELEAGDATKPDGIRRGASGDNTRQNDTVDDAANQVGLNDRQRDELGREVETRTRDHQEDLGYGDIVDIAKDIKEGKN